MSQQRAESASRSVSHHLIAALRRLARILAVLFALGALALTILLALLRHEHNTEIELPKPTGHFAVGRTTYMWVNNDEADELSRSPGAKREVAVWIWYPAAEARGQQAEYLPAPWRSALSDYSGVLMSQFLTRDLSRVRAHSIQDADVSPEQPSYQVVIMRAGLGALTTDYTTLAEDLASHGYIVVGFDAPERTCVVVLADGRVVMRPQADNPENFDEDEAIPLVTKLLVMWVDDTKFVLEKLQELNASGPSGKFAGRLDIAHLGMFGHSFGGAQALQFCHDDSRCKAGIDIDGAPFGSVVQEGIKQPFMFLMSDHSRERQDAAAKRIGADIYSIYDRLPSGRGLVTIRGANHFSFSDQMLLKSRIGTKTLSVLGFGSLEGRRGLAITSGLVRTFFDVYLKGASARSIQDELQLYPEVQASSDSVF
jgi:predicted dienelactone hydrolase